MFWNFAFDTELRLLRDMTKRVVLIDRGARAPVAARAGVRVWVGAGPRGGGGARARARNAYQTNLLDEEHRDRRAVLVERARQAWGRGSQAVCLGGFYGFRILFQIQNHWCESFFASRPSP